MRNDTTARLRTTGLIALLLGAVLVVAGVATTVLIRDQLAREDITLHADAPVLAGHQVDDPLEAFLQARVIEQHAAGIADGASYAELDRDDPRRERLAEASFVRASLFTSVIAFGVAAVVVALGVVALLLGTTARQLAAAARREEPAAEPVPAPAPATA